MSESILQVGNSMSSRINRNQNNNNKIILGRGLSEGNTQADRVFEGRIDILNRLKHMEITNDICWDALVSCEHC